jgi:dTDP-4-dehydrorhamnose 3,5-epimerase-like enzyme
MAEIIKLPTHIDSRGSLTVIEKVLPFEIKRVYYIYNCNDLLRGGHRHKKTIQALICIKGSCSVRWNNGKTRDSVILNSPDELLLVMPEDYHTMSEFSKDSILLVLASEYYDKNDYIGEDYTNDIL